jgi:glycine betaine/proline transport system ATP-binding protein
MRDGKVIQVGTPEEIVVSPADEYVADFVKGISRLKVVQAKSIMQTVESYEKKNGKLWDDPESVQETDLLSKLIEKSKSKDKPLIVNNSKNQVIGVITQADLLKAVIEGGDGE